ncbi:hypothetical protein [Sutcliffiella deserti]|uniref:hypothetical protein n=1 Tax=Sutcliffiella deserti TaxID=2875501 RepID=UPI001CBC5DC9|nr:hypothetical protein [Sutcliffiella deserti]
MSCKNSRINHCKETLGSISPQRVKPISYIKPSCIENSCEVATHKVQGNADGLTGNIPINIFVPGGTENLIVFEDYTENHNKTFLQLSAESSPLDNSFSVLDVLIYTRDSEDPIEVSLSTNPFGPVFSGIPRGVQVENFVRLTVSNPIENAGVLRAYIEKTFCICCRENGVR